MLGSNVKGEARNITSLDLTDRTDLKNKITECNVRYEVLMVVKISLLVFWAVMPCGIVYG
jgi:hypothetical protein